MLKEEHIDEIRQFLSSTAYTWALQQYNTAVINKLSILQRMSLSGDMSKINVEGGRIAGFKEGFEFLENVCRGSKEKEL